MKSIGAFAAKTHFSSLLASVERGEEITITRRGRPVARLVPVVADPERDLADVIRRLKASREETKLGGLSIRELIEEGRM